MQVEIRANSRARVVVFTFDTHGESGGYFECMTARELKEAEGDPIFKGQDTVRFPNHARAKFYNLGHHEDVGYKFMAIFAFCQAKMTTRQIRDDLLIFKDAFENFQNMDNFIVTEGLPLVREKYRFLVKDFDSRLSVVSNCIS